MQSCLAYIKDMKNNTYLYAVGGTSFDVRLIADYDASRQAAGQDGEYLGRTEFGDLDAEGQYHGDDDEIIDHVRAEYSVADEIPAGVR